MIQKILIFLLLILVYSFTLRGALGDTQLESLKGGTDATEPFESSHERAPYALLISLVENKTPVLTQELGNFAAPDAGYSNGKFFILFAPGVSLLLTPFYVLGKYLGFAQLATYFSSILFSALSTVVVVRTGQNVLKLKTWEALICGLTFAFATTSWSYGITIYQHSYTVFFLMSAFYAAWSYQLSTRFSWLWGLYVWFAYGVGIFLDYPNALLFLPIMLYFSLSALKITTRSQNITFGLRPSLILTMVTFVVVTLLHGYYNQVSFGNWKTIGQSLPRYENEEDLQRLEAQASVPQVKKGSPISIFKEERIANGLYTLTVAPDKGIFFYSPVLLLALWGVWNIRKRLTTEHWILLSIVLVNFFIYASFADPWGGWAYGPRYMVPTMAVLALFVGIWLHTAVLSLTARIIFMLLFIYSTAIAVLGALTTNIVPPKIEAVPLNLKYNFMLNLDYLVQNRTDSVIYKTFFSNLSLIAYGVSICIAVYFVTAFVLFVLPRFSKKHD